MNPHAYNITVRQVEIDGALLFEARVRELPDVVDYGDNWEEAYGLAVDTIETTAQVMAEQGRRLPEPASVEEDYSGRVTLRVPKSLHRRLADQAEHEGVSLNHYMVTLLAHGCGTDFGVRQNEETEWSSGDVADVDPQARAKPHLELISSNDFPEDGWGHTG